MTTYYEMLKISPSASTAEIQAAIDAQYDQWRRLVAHHSPEVVEQANQSLRILETIRATLTDPNRRALYDASLNVGGLADPEAVIRMHGEPPPPPLKPGGSPGSPGDRPVDAWVCPQCGTSSPRGTRHCNRCSAQLGIDCPKCGKLTLKSAPFCAECGANLQAEFERQRIEKQAQEAEAANRRIAILQTQVQAEQKEIARIEKLLASLWPWIFYTLGAGQPRVGCAGTLLVLMFVFLILMLPLALVPVVGSSNIGLVLALWCLVALPAAAVAAGTIRRQFGRESVLKELQTHQLRLAELNREVSVISARTSQPS